MRKALAIAGFTVAILFLAVPTPTYAANATFFGPIVPKECHCDNQIDPTNPTGPRISSAPDYGCVLQTIENAINFAVSISIILFIIYLTIAGFRLVTSGGSSEARSQAKTRLLNVVVGLAVLLCSWLLVDWVMKTIYNNGSFGPWNAILAPTDTTTQCIVATKPGEVATGSVGLNLSSTTSNGGNATTIGGASGASGLNINTAISYAMANKKSESGGQCALYVEKALAAGGVSGITGNGNSIGPSLVQHGFTKVITGVIGDSFSGLQSGDVVSIAGGSSSKCSDNHKKYGHTEIYTGSGWVSDYYSNNIYGFGLGDCAKGEAFTIYRP